jgi:hypothetical protein
MDNHYYSERLNGERPREDQSISLPFWGGFVALIEARSLDGWFAERYPRHCFEAPLPTETDAESLGAALAAHVPGIAWPLNRQNLPNALDVLDAIEFFARIVSMPSRRVHHDYGRHHHITSFDRQSGIVDFCQEVNTMLRRCGHPYELNTLGEIRRLGPPVLREVLDLVVASGDWELDRILAAARQKFQDPNSDVRKEGLEKLWDAWERLKTLLPGDKKNSTKALLDSSFNEPALRERIEWEARELTEIGNTFMIRHSEVGKIPISNTHHVDYLFHRMFALILVILRIRVEAGV